MNIECAGNMEKLLGTFTWDHVGKVSASWSVDQLRCRDSHSRRGIFLSAARDILERRRALSSDSHR